MSANLQTSQIVLRCATASFVREDEKSSFICVVQIYLRLLYFCIAWCMGQGTNERFPVPIYCR